MSTLLPPGPELYLERVFTNKGHYVYRVRLAEGWLLVYDNHPTFIFDPKHLWDGQSDRLPPTPAGDASANKGAS